MCVQYARVQTHVHHLRYTCARLKIHIIFFWFLSNILDVYENIGGELSACLWRANGAITIKPSSLNIAGKCLFLQFTFPLPVRMRRKWGFRHYNLCSGLLTQVADEGQTSFDIVCCYTFTTIENLWEGAFVRRSEISSSASFIMQPLFVYLIPRLFKWSLALTSHLRILWRSGWRSTAADSCSLHTYNTHTFMYAYTDTHIHNTHGCIWVYKHVYISTYIVV